LGFDRMAWSYPGAMFFGADGYHHHLGTNLWAGPAALPATAEDARLREWTIDMPDQASVAAATASLSTLGFDSTQQRGDTVAIDPWGTAVRLRVGTEPLRQAVPRAVTS
jgi:catechol 2,3-dioxygenase